jgi:hypothetical protein
MIDIRLVARGMGVEVLDTPRSGAAALTRQERLRPATTPRLVPFEHVLMTRSRPCRSQIERLDVRSVPFPIHARLRGQNLVTYIHRLGGQRYPIHSGHPATLSVALDAACLTAALCCIQSNPVAEFLELVDGVDNCLSALRWVIPCRDVE